MCGLVGCYGNYLSVDAKKIFSTLLYLDVYRGLDSTGVAMIDKPNDKGEDNVSIHKCLGGPWNLFLNDEKFDKKGDEIKAYGIRALIGHNRACTWGEVNIDNAHPFDIGDIVGAHNGTLHDTTLKDLPYYNEYNVDSQVLFAHIHEVGIEQAYKDIGGAMALTWYDRYYDSMNILRNSQRPLHCCFASDNETFFWASEEWMLRSAFMRARANMNPNGVMIFQPNFHYMLGIKNRKVYFQSMEELQPRPWVQTPASNHNHPRPATQQASSYSHVPSTNHNTTKGKNNVSLAGPPADKEVEASYQTLEVERSDDFANGYGQYILTRKMFEELTKGGCVCCHSDIKWEDKNDIQWPRPEVPVCSDCKDVAHQWVQ